MSLAWNQLCQYRKLLPVALAQMLLLADQPLLPANMSQVATEFGFDDAERDQKLGGTVAVVFFSAGAISSISAGRLADVMDRRKLVFGFTFLGGLGSFLNSRVSGFTGLLVCRAAAGTAIGGLVPAIYSIMGDLYKADQRPKAVAMLSVITGFGPALGQALAGFMGPELGWRAPFAVVGVMSTSLAIILMCILEDPPKAETSSSEKSGCALLCAAVAKPTVLLVYLQGIAGCMPWAVISTFLTDYLAVDGHLGLEGATALSISFGIGNVTGTIAGGKLGQHLYLKDKRFLVLLMAVAAWAGMLPMILLISAAGSWGSVWVCHCLDALGGLFSPVAGCNAKAVLLNTVPCSSRGVVFGVYNIMDDLGKGLGPVFVSSFIRHFGRRASFIFGISMWLPCGFFCLLMCRTILADDISEPNLARTRLEDSS